MVVQLKHQKSRSTFSQRVQLVFKETCFFFCFSHMQTYIGNHSYDLISMRIYETLQRNIDTNLETAKTLQFWELRNTFILYKLLRGPKGTFNKHLYTIQINNINYSRNNCTANPKGFLCGTKQNLYLESSKFKFSPVLDCVRTEKSLSRLNLLKPFFFFEIRIC